MSETAADRMFRSLREAEIAYDKVLAAAQRDIGSAFRWGIVLGAVAGFLAAAWYFA